MTVRTKASRRPDGIRCHSSLAKVISILLCTLLCNGIAVFSCIKNVSALEVLIAKNTRLISCCKNSLCNSYCTCCAGIHLEASVLATSAGIRLIVYKVDVSDLTA